MIRGKFVTYVLDRGIRRLSEFASKRSIHRILGCESLAEELLPQLGTGHDMYGL